MKKFFFLLLPVLIVGCSSEPLIQQPDSSDAISSEATRFIHMKSVEKPTEVLVKFKKEYGEGIEQEIRSSRSMGQVSRSGISRFDEFLDLSSAVSFERVFPVGKFEQRMRESGMNLWYKVTFENALTSSELKENLEKMPELSVVEMISPISIGDDKLIENKPKRVELSRSANNDSPMNDPILVDQWHYQNDGTLNEQAKIGADINLFKAWERTKGNPNVIVGIVDGFVQFNHPDLKDNMWINEAEANGRPGVDDDCNGYIDDIHGYNFMANSADDDFYAHGTHVAGTIAAVNNNGEGVCGIAGGSGNGDGVRLMSCGVLSGSYQGDIYSASRAIVYATDNGANILQNSWGYFNVFENEDILSKGVPFSLEREALEYFIKNAGYDVNGNVVGPMAGGVAIFSAGNSGNESGSRMSFPAAYPEMICVGALGCDYRPAYYTCYGPWVDISAPGGDQLFDGEEGGVLSTGFIDDPDDYDYVYMQGTSMACPHVSGVAALVLSYAKSKNFTLTNSQMKDILLSSGRNIEEYFVGKKEYPGYKEWAAFYMDMSEYKGKLGNGLIDANLALDRVDQLMGIPDGHVSPSAVENAKAVATNVAGTISVGWELTADCQNHLLQSYSIYFSTSDIKVDNGKVVQDYYTQGPVIIPVQENSQVGDNMVHMLDGLENGKKYHIAIVGYDQWRSASEPKLLTATTKRVVPISPLVNLRVSDMTSHSLILKWEEVLDAEGRPYESYEVKYYMKDNPGSSILVYISGKKEEGYTVWKLFDDLFFGHSYVFEVRGFDQNLTPSEVSTIECTLPSKIDLSEFEEENEIQYWEAKSFNIKVADYDYSPFTMIMDEQEGWSLEEEKDLYVLKFEGPVSDESTGQVSIVIHCEDSKFGKFRLTFSPFVVPNVQPEVLNSLPDQYLERNEKKVEVLLNDFFADKNKETLVYTVEVDGESVSAQIMDGDKLLIERLKSGLSEIKVRGTDHGGLYVENSFKVMARRSTSPMELYPNPVRNVLNVRLGQDVAGEIKVNIKDHNGHVVCEVINEVSAFAPAKIDMKGVKRGNYQVEVEHEGHVYKGNIIKQ